jgi:hypothetical protein
VTLLEQTIADLGRLNADELEAIHYLIVKLIAGSAKHGPLALASDRRDWPSEMVEEYADALFYAAFASVQRQRRTAPIAGLAGLAARESAPVEKVARPGHDADCHGGYVCEASCGREPAITSDAYWQRHPIGSPERVQAIEEHRAARK